MITLVLRSSHRLAAARLLLDFVLRSIRRISSRPNQVYVMQGVDRSEQRLTRPPRKCGVGWEREKRIEAKRRPMRWKSTALSSIVRTE